MADSTIRFKIGSQFSGDGFKKAQAAVKEVSSEVKKGTNAAAQIANALGSMDSAASKNMQSMSRLAGAIATMNATSIAMAVEMEVINRLFQGLVEKTEEYKASVDRMKVSVQQAFASQLQADIKKVNTEVAGIITEFESATKQANQFAAAIEGVRSAEANGGVVNLQLEKLNALLEAHSEAERETIEQTYNLKIAIAKSANVEAEWAAKQDAAHQEIIDQQDRVAKINEQLATLGAERARLEEVMNAAKASNDENWRKIEAEVIKLRDQERTLAEKRNAAESEIVILQEKEKQVKQEATNAQTQATIAIREAELAETKLNEAKHAREVAETAAAEETELDEASERNMRNAVDQAKIAKENERKAAEELKKAEKEYKNALNYYAEHISDVLIAEAAVGGTLNNSKDAKARQQLAADAAVVAGIANGTINNSKQAAAARKAAARADRNLASSSEVKQLERDAQRAERIRKMGEKSRSKQDQQFLDDYEQMQKVRDERAAKLEDAEDVIAGWDDVSDISDTLDDIKDLLEGLGLQ